MDRDVDDVLDEWLVLRAQGGDKSALQLLVRRWHPKLVRHARKLIEREDVAADVVQDGWIAIFRGLKRLQDPATFPGWVYRIVHHKSIDWIRRQVQQRKLDQEVAEQVNSTRNSAMDEGSTDVEKLRNCLRRLTAEQQLLLRMYYDDRMPLKEIAVVLAVPVGTLKFRLYSIRKQLKKMIERETS